MRTIIALLVATTCGDSQAVDPSTQRSTTSPTMASEDEANQPSERPVSPSDETAASVHASAPRMTLVYETEATRRCPVRDAAFFPRDEHLVVVGTEGIHFVDGDERTDNEVPEPIHRLVYDGDDLVAFGRYGLIARLRVDAEAPTVRVESTNLGLPRAPLYRLQRDGGILRAVSAGVVLRFEGGEWAREALGPQAVRALVGDALAHEMHDSIHPNHAYDIDSDRHGVFSEDGTTVRFDGTVEPRELPLPAELTGDEGLLRGAFSEGRFAAWRGRYLALLDFDERWTVFEMPDAVSGFRATTNEPLIVFSCQRVWTVSR